MTKSATAGNVSITVDFSTGAITVAGPSVAEWIDSEAAMRLARLFNQHAPSVEMAIALAYHQLYADWAGKRDLIAALA